MDFFSYFCSGGKWRKVEDLGFRHAFTLKPIKITQK